MFFAVFILCKFVQQRLFAFVQILDHICTPVKQRSFFQNLVSCNICQQDPCGDPSGGGCQILPVTPIFTWLFCCFSAVLFVVVELIEVMLIWMGCALLPRWKGGWNFIYFFCVRFVFYINAANGRWLHGYQNSLQTPTWSQPGELPPSARPLYRAAVGVENKLP